MAKKLLCSMVTVLALSITAPVFAEVPFIAGARALGMGGAFSAVADDASSLYWNPAGLGDLRKRELTAMYSKDAFSTAYLFAAYAQPVDGFGGCAAGWSRTATDFEKTDSFGNVTGDGTVASDAVMIGASYYQSLPVSFGIAVRGTRESIDMLSLSGMSADLGLLYAHEPFRAALVCRNAWSSGLNGTSVAGSGSVSEQMLAELRGGVAVTLGTGVDIADEGKTSRIPVTFTVACDYAASAGSSREAEINPGAELWMGKTFAVRSGLSNLKDFSAGVSLQLSVFRLDYAFITSSTLENQHLVSTTFFF